MKAKILLSAILLCGEALASDSGYENFTGYAPCQQIDSLFQRKKCESQQTTYEEAESVKLFGRLRDLIGLESIAEMDKRQDKAGCEAMWWVFGQKTCREKVEAGIGILKGEAAALNKALEKRKAFQIADSAAVEAAETARKKGPKKTRISVGMSAKQARASNWGEPEKIIRSSTPLGDGELWIYDSTHIVHIHEGRVASITY